MTMTQDEAIEQADKVRAMVVAALAEVPGLYAYDDGVNFTRNAYGAPFIFDAFWEDEPRPEGFGPDRRYWVTASVVTYVDAARPLGDGYVEVTWVNEIDLENEWHTILPMTFVAAADLGDGEPLARLAVDAIRAHRATTSKGA